MDAMTSPNLPSDTPDGLAVLLGPRQAQVMRLFWTLGSATAREIHAQIERDTSLAYTTVTTICSRLVEMGLLLQQPVLAPSRRPSYRPPNRYTPSISEADFVRAEVGLQLDRLLAHYEVSVYEHLTRVEQLRPRPEGLDQPASLESLRRRAELAERRADALAVEAASAYQQVQAATQRTMTAERQAQEALAEAQRAHQRTLLIEEDTAAALRRSKLQRYSKARAIVEHYDPSGICRVCGQEAAPLVKQRRDGLRICGNAACVSEARRRDNLVKQRQYQDRRRLQRAKQDTPA
jgi:predicted transcriptional regulator